MPPGAPGSTERAVAIRGGGTGGLEASTRREGVKRRRICLQSGMVLTPHTHLNTLVAADGVDTLGFVSVRRERLSSARACEL